MSLRIVEQAGKSQCQILVPEKLGGLVSQADALFDGRYQRLQADRVAQPQEIQPAYAGRDARTERRGSGRARRRW